MIQTSTLELGNVVYVSEKVTTTTNTLRGVVIGIKEDKIKVHTDNMEVECNPEQIYPIPLFKSEILNIGFTQRSLNTMSETTNDLVMSIETDPNEWYLLALTEDLFLTIRKNGVNIIGSGMVSSYHQLQNLINQITNGKIKIN